MSVFRKMTTLILILAFCISSSTHKLEAITYVTDTGGYAYDEARAATNLAPAIALATVAIVGIIAIAVQNSHDHSSSGHYGCSSSHYGCSCGSNNYSGGYSDYSYGY